MFKHKLKYGGNLLIGFVGNGIAKL